MNTAAVGHIHLTATSPQTVSRWLRAHLARHSIAAEPGHVAELDHLTRWRMSADELKATHAELHRGEGAS